MSAPAIIVDNLSFDGFCPKSGRGGKPRVLYAEDQTSSRIVTTALLHRMGLEVDAVEDGELALRKAETADYDVILLDIEMPVMDGVTAARCIRELEAHARTPILALSAFLADSTEHSVWRTAFDYALPKPANSNELQRAIHRMLSSVPGLNADEELVEIRLDAKVPDALAQALRAALSPGSWNRLQAMAAGEAVHYANAALSALEAGDKATHQRCLMALKALAENFAAHELAELVHKALVPSEEQPLILEQTKALHQLAIVWQDQR